MLSEVTLKQMEQFTLPQRTIIFQFLYPNGPEPLDDAEWQFFWDLHKEGVIEFAHQGTANEHLHVTHGPSEHRYWCVRCENAIVKAA